MKNYKGNMLLIELIIVILFFSLSQLVVVRLFAAAHQKAADSGLMADALSYCEDVAERLSGESNPDAVLMEMGFVGGNGQYVYSSAQGFDAEISLSRESGPGGELLRAVVTARAKEQTLVTLPVSFYLAKEAAS